MKRYENLSTPRQHGEKMRLRDRAKKALGNTAIGIKYAEVRATAAQVSKRYESTAKPLMAVRLEKDVKGHLGLLAEKNQASRVVDAIQPNSIKAQEVARQEASLEFAIRAESIFDGGNNTSSVHPYSESLSVATLRHEINPDDLPEWATRDAATSTLSDAPLTAHLRRVVDLHTTKTGETTTGLPKYDLVVSRMSYTDGGRMIGVNTVYSFDTKRNQFDGHSTVGNPNYVLHGRHEGMAGPQSFPKDVSNQEIGELL